VAAWAALPAMPCSARKTVIRFIPKREAGTCPSTIGSLDLAGMRELIFEVIQEADGGYCAECLTETVVTEGDTWEEFRQNVREVVRAFYFDQPDKLPTTLRLHLVRDEVLAYA
jgi:predicted RNase H-like HicB family nuclease